MSVDMSYLDRIAELTLYARLAWAAAAAALLLYLGLLLFLRRKSARPASPLQRMARLHEDRGATASMEYLMVLMPFLVIVMTIWQLAFMINAKLHVSYATFAAARSAAVMIPAQFDGEEPGKLAQQTNSKESKWTRIERAAIPGTIAVSPGSAGDAGGVFAAHNGYQLLSGGGFDGVEVPNPVDTGSRLILMSMHMCDTPIFCSPEALTGTRPGRTAVKDLYAQTMTTVRVQGQDSSQAADLSSQDVITVSVDYVFWLQVPWVGRLFEAGFKGFLNPVTKEPLIFNPYPSMTMSEQTSIKVWHKKRAIEPCP